MSLTQYATNGHSQNGHATPTVEYSEAVERQTRVDAELAGARFTGVTQDTVTGDWICWRRGRIIGWAKTPGDAAERVNDCEAAHEAHPQTLGVSTAREELPCSIEFQRSSKGEAYWTAKYYFAPGDEADAIERLGAIDADLARRYRPELVPAS